MPMIKRRPFEANKTPENLKSDEEVYYLKLTNEIFRDYDEYFERVILCNSMVWSCSLTGKANLTFQEALDTEKLARKQIKAFPLPLKKSLLYLSMTTTRGRASDVVDDVLVYARDRYFKGEEVMAVIGNLWCKSRVVSIIPPTLTEIEAYKKEQISKGEAENNDYLKDDSWGPSPDLFRYEVEEVDPDADATEVHILEAIDVKREKTLLTRDKCKFLLKIAMDYDEQSRKFVLKSDLINKLGLSKVKFEDLFVGKAPEFEVSLGPLKATPSKSRSSQKETTEKGAKKTSVSKIRDESKTSPKTTPAGKGVKTPKTSDSSKGSAKKSAGKVEPKPKKEKLLTPQELKQIELERKAKEREKNKLQRQMIADFKKLWFKPKEDLEVEDLKDLPTPDPVSCKIPNNLFGEFMMVLEFVNSYSTILKVRDSFTSGINFDSLERALTSNEIAGPFSDILQVLLKTIFRLQEGEQIEIAKEDTADPELPLSAIGEEISVDEAIDHATAAATWSYVYQNTPLYKLGVDYSTLTEVLRLHLLASGARQSPQARGSCNENEDPGLQLRIEEPQILQTLTSGTVFDLNMEEKLKVIQSLIHQILSYSAVKDIQDDSYDRFKQARNDLRTLQAAEKRKETEDHLWRQKLKADNDPNALKAEAVADETDSKEGGKEKSVKKSKEPEKQPEKPLLTEEQIQTALTNRDKETARRKQDFLWKEAELLDQISKHERKLGSHPFGRDRAYRRYWVFPTVSGLFVEYDDEFLGECLPTPTPCWESVNLDDVNFIKENLKKLKQIDKEGSDKENSLLSPKKTPKKKTPVTPGKKEKEAVRPSVFGVCTGDKDSCPVHCPDLPRAKWAFFWDPDQIDSLIAGLTPRGIREKELRQSLVDEKDNLKSIIKKCPVTKLNQDKTYPENIASAPERRPQRKAGSSKTSADLHLGFPWNTPINTIMELQLRDLILETEEKMFLGGLGSLKVDDRTEWRSAMESRSFKAGTKVLKWGGEKKALEFPNTRSSTSSETTDILPVVRDLACAILQLQQGVEGKFMNRPLVEKEDEKKKKSKPGESEPAWKASMNSSSHLERWQSSLMASNSFSQLFVHFYTLDSSVEWTRSVLNARCRVCRRKGDPEKMLLCDKCNKGHHAYCLKPPLENIPKGDWFCVDCRPAEPLPTPSKKRKVLSDDEILNELDSSDEDDSQRGRSKKMSDLQQDEDLEVCAECGFGGEVICCDSCPLVYHLLCLNPPRTRVPRGDWNCPECVNPKKKRGAPKSRSVKALVFDDSSESSAEESEDEKTLSEESRSSTPSAEPPKLEKAVRRRKRVIEDESSSDRNIISEDEDEEEEEEEEEKREVVKVKFTPSRKRTNAGASSSTYPTRSVQKTYEDESESEEEEQVGRGRKRKSASVAAEKIANAAKRLRSDSKENETSETSNDSSYNTRKPSIDTNDQSTDGKKRTRLQRMNTNNRVENGELDNVMLDKLISDVMKQNDAWPFLKPVTRTEAPDYHEIVKDPMDLGTIKYKLNSMVYTCNEEFISDLLLVFTNCFSYNDHSNHIYQAGRSLKSYCEKRCSKLGINFSDSVPS